MCLGRVGIILLTIFLKKEIYIVLFVGFCEKSVKMSTRTTWMLLDAFGFQDLYLDARKSVS